MASRFSSVILALVPSRYSYTEFLPTPASVARPALLFENWIHHGLASPGALLDFGRLFLQTLRFRIETCVREFLGAWKPTIVSLALCHRR
jgi:hypothetical protein